MNFEPHDYQTYAIDYIETHPVSAVPVSYTHLRAHETGRNLVCRLLLEKKKKKKNNEVFIQR